MSWVLHRHALHGRLGARVRLPGYGRRRSPPRDEADLKIEAESSPRSAELRAPAPRAPSCTSSSTRSTRRRAFVNENPGSAATDRMPGDFLGRACTTATSCSPSRTRRGFRRYAEILESRHAGMRSASSGTSRLARVAPRAASSPSRPSRTWWKYGALRRNEKARRLWWCGEHPSEAGIRRHRRRSSASIEDNGNWPPDAEPRQGAFRHLIGPPPSLALKFPMRSCAWNLPHRVRALSSS